MSLQSKNGYLTISVARKLNGKVIFILILCLAICYQLNAQSWKFGIEGGPTWSRINAQSVDNEESRFGYQVRLWLNKEIKPKISLQTGPQFITKGAVNERSLVQNPNSMITWKYNLSYINVPLELLYRPHRSITIGGGIYTGFLLGFNVGREANFSSSINSPNKDNLRSNDLGYIFRTSFNLPPISIGLNYQHSFVELPKSEVASRLIEGARNSSIQFYVGYTLFKSQ